MVGTLNGAPPAPSRARQGAKVHQNGGLVEIRIKLSGVTPLLFNAMTLDQLLAIRNKVKPAKNAAKPEPREEANDKVHRDGDGNPAIPLRMMMSNLIGAGQHVRLDGKRQISTSTTTILPGMLRITGRHIPILDAAGEPSKWEVDIQQGRNPNGGEAVCIIRPRFDVWNFGLTVQVDQQQMSLSMARNLVDIAGARLGLGDFRPHRKGTYGQYDVVGWEEVAD